MTKDKEGFVSRKERLKIRKKKIRNKKKIFLLSLLGLIIIAIAVVFYINSFGGYPWGSESFGHLYKGNILYDAFLNGDYFLNYDPNWHNGIQPFRYWAPMPYYILAIINLVTNNIFVTYNVFVAFIFIFGGVGFLLWGYYRDRQGLAFILGVLWFFIPHNLKVLFSEGNFPYAIVNSLVPYVFLAYYKSLLHNKVFNYICLALLMGIITLNHAMLAAMMGVALLIFAVIHSLLHKSYMKNFLCLVIAFLGILLTSFWLIPALQGGLMSLDKGAVAEVMKDQSFPLSLSLNPFLRLENREIYYFGLGLTVVAIFGVFFAKKREKIGFVGALVILLGTTTVALPILKELPLNQVFWMNRFTSIAACMVFISILLWCNLRKGILYTLIFIIALDSSISLRAVMFNREYPSDKAEAIESAGEIAISRIGMMDNSRNGSFPSHFISYNENANVRKQAYGWAWQGATTADNIVTINYGLEKEYYALIFDRSIELGIDTLVFIKDRMQNYEELDYWAKKLNYYKYYENDRDIVYKLNVDGEFGTIVKYDGLAIGKYSTNILYNFPNFIVGESEYIDDYTIEELMEYKTIYLSGFKYKDKIKSEALIEEIAEKGVRVVIDSTGIDDKGFLGMKPQSLSLKKNYGDFYYQGKKVAIKDFPKELNNFVCSFFSDYDKSEMKDYLIAGNMKIPYLFEKSENLLFMGLNLGYFGTETKDEVVLNVLSSALNMERNKLPYREIVNVKTTLNGDKELVIESDKEGVLTSIAALDAFTPREGEISKFNNLVKVQSKKVIIDIGYPAIKIGMFISIIALGVLISIMIGTRKKRFINILSIKEGGGISG